MPPVVWRVSVAEIERAVPVIARAFHDQPIFVAAVPDPAERGQLLTALYRYGLRLGRALGQCWAVGARVGTIDGAALVLEMPLPDRSAAQQDALGFAPIAARWQAPHDQVQQTVEAAVAAIPELPAAWRYLDTLAVDPARQGHGLGKALLRRLLDEAARDGRPLALVSDRPSNVPFYERAGLDLVWQGQPPGGLVPLWSFRTRR